MSNERVPDSQSGMTEIGRLIDRIRAGQSNARKELMDQCYQRFVLIARRLLNSRRFNDLRGRGVDTAEVVNETFLTRIFKENQSGRDLLARQDFDGPKEFIGAVARHMEFCLKDIVIGRGGAAFREARQDSNPPSTGGRQAHDKVAAPSDEKLALLVESLAELDEKDRDVIRFRYLMEMSREEVAATLGVSTKYVTRHARQGLEQLGKKFGGSVTFS